MCRIHAGKTGNWAMRQVERITKDLMKHPEIIKQQFGAKATWKHTHAVVLNASFLSFPKSRNGTFFYDASALGRFLKEGALNEVQSVPLEGKRVHVSVEIKRLWKGEHPTARDLLKEMEHPSQVTMEWDKYYIARKLLRLSGTSAVMIQEAASKPPDFEPLPAPHDTKVRHAKVSNRISRRRSKRVLSRRRRK